MEKNYLNYKDASYYSSYSVNTLRSFVSRGIFQEGIHFIRPRGKRSKLLFCRSALESWLHGNMTKEHTQVESES